jgi:hypothetical protein
MSEEARSRLPAVTRLSDQQWADLQNGNLMLPPDQLAHLTGLSKQFGDMTPAQIVEAMNDEADHGKGIAGAFALASNPNVNTGRFGAGESGRAPTRGNVSLLPEGVQSMLNGKTLQTYPGAVPPSGGPPLPTPPRRSIPACRASPTSSRAPTRDCRPDPGWTRR